jgi:hypothetical protein
MAQFPGRANPRPALWMGRIAADDIAKWRQVLDRFTNHKQPATRLLCSSDSMNSRFAGFTLLRRQKA